MFGNFSYCNPTRLYFGEDAMGNLKQELEKYGENVLLCYGGGSIKKNGIYDQVMALPYHLYVIAKIRASCRIRRWKSSMKAYSVQESAAQT